MAGDNVLCFLVLFAGLCATTSVGSAKRQAQGLQGDFSLPARVRGAEARMELATRQLQGRSAEHRKVSQYQIALEVSAPVSEVDPQFLSVTIDAGDVSRNWSGITFTAQRIINMARGLTPAMLRVGGTSGDFLIFNSSSAHAGS